MRVGAVSLGWSGTPLREVFDQLRALGGECLELNSRPGLHAQFVLNRETLPQVRHWLADTGVVIGSVSGYNDFAVMEPPSLAGEVERLLGACRLASELGVSLVRAFVGESKAGQALDDVWPRLVQGFQLAAREAQTLGVTLGIENHGRLLNDGAGLARLVREIGAPNVGITLDTGNFSWAGHDPVQTEADFQAVLPYVVNVHVKDGVWHSHGFEFVPAGQGELDLVALIGQLGRRGYAGPIYSEYEGRGDFTAGTRDSIAFLRRIVAQVGHPKQKV